MEDFNKLEKKVEKLEYDRIQVLEKEVGNIKITLAENNVLTKQCVESNSKLNDTMDSLKETMLIMSESMKRSNKTSEELATNIKNLDSKIENMDERINHVNDKSKIDILDWVKQNWFGVVMGIGMITYVATQMIK